MGKASKVKGARGERFFARQLQERGIAAERIPLSGQHGGMFSGDISVPVLGLNRRFECKLRGDGFKEIYKWLDDNFGLFLKADRKPPLVVLELSDFIDLLTAAEKRKDVLPLTVQTTLQEMLDNHSKQQASEANACLAS